MKASRAPRRVDSNFVPAAPTVPGSALRPERFIGAGDAVATAPNETDGPRVLRFERRRGPRDQATGLMAATFTNGRDRYGIAQFRLLDRSADGLGAWTTTEIEPGMSVALSPVGSNVAWLTGRAVRCEREGDGYRVGVALTAPRMAA